MAGGDVNPVLAVRVRRPSILEGCSGARRDPHPLERAAFGVRRGLFPIMAGPMAVRVATQSGVRR